MLKKGNIFFMTLLLAFSGASFSQQTNQHDDHAVAALSDTPRQPAYVAEVEPLTPIALGKPATLKLTIKQQNGNIAKHKDFKVMHGRRLHLMSVNKDLRDYQHMHPRPEDLDGEAVYEFEVVPTQGGTYQLYADVVDASDGTNYLLPVTFFVPGQQQKPVIAENLEPGEIQKQGFADGLTFKASIKPTPVVAGENLMLDITVSQNGDPFRRLEPTMQAFAHLVGFSENLDTMIHAHPMGEKLTSPSQRGGPNLMFHLVFPSAGKYRLFLQIKVEGEDVFVPFDVEVI